MDTLDRDKEASDLQEQGLTWAAVAERMHYANGSVARRCALRHRARAGDPMPEPISIARNLESNPVPTVERPACFTPTDVLYHVAMPKATFKFIKWNKDGSASVWGGEPSHEMYRDFRVEVLSAKPSTPIEAMMAWATDNLFEIVTVDELAERFGATASTTRNAVQSNPDRFRRVGHGKYETRDPQEDRKADRRSA